MRAPLRQPLALAGVTTANAKIIAEHLIIARIFAPKLEGRFEPQSTKLVMMTSESIAITFSTYGSVTIMVKIAVVGATGPTGIHLVTELRKTVATVRGIARSMDKLVRLFPEAAVEKWEADIRDADATLRAIEGCDLVYDCIGLPSDQMHLHPVAARNIAVALGHTKARCVQVSSYWAYYPQVRTEMNEDHPRSGGPPWVRYRREAEDVLRDAGAAILHLPDFYGPMCM